MPETNREPEDREAVDEAALSARLESVRAEIADAERAAGREPGGVDLLPVSKFHPAAAARAITRLGGTDLGENRDQEARDKAAEVPEAAFHMIGQIQTKKANSVARWAAAVHSVDSVRLAEKLDHGVALALERGDRSATAPGGALGPFAADGVVPCLVQLSADGDTSRGGATEEDLPAVLDALEAAEHLAAAGVMCVPPLDSDPKEVFDRARAIADREGERLGRNLVLSAGMTADLTEAIAAGSDIVRVGTAIFGPRPVA